MNKRQFKDIISNTCLNGSEYRASDLNGWVPRLNTHWVSFLLQDFFVSLSKVSGVNIAICHEFVKNSTIDYLWTCQNWMFFLQGATGKEHLHLLFWKKFTWGQVTPVQGSFELQTSLSWLYFWNIQIWIKFLKTNITHYLDIHLYTHQRILILDEYLRSYVGLKIGIYVLIESMSGRNVTSFGRFPCHERHEYFSGNTMHRAVFLKIITPLMTREMRQSALTLVINLWCDHAWHWLPFTSSLNLPINKENK